MAPPSVTGTQAENSDVLLFESVAVAVMKPAVAPPSTVNVAAPEAFVVTLVDPIGVCPSPFPEASHAAFEKSSIRNVALGVLLSVPTTLVVVALAVADASTGKFWRLFAPVSTSPASFGVTPLLSRSMPSEPLAVMLLPRIALAVLSVSTTTPLCVLPEIRLRWAAVVPPI